MTWGEFKAWMEQQGVKDDDVLNYIDMHGFESSSLQIHDEPGLGWSVYS